jgi:GNAT superfamily N-acetyltransferase
MRLVPYAHPDVSRLVDELQSFFGEIYGEPDRTPVDGTEFDGPDGAFFVAYEADEPVAMGGWRRLPPGLDGVPGESPVEIKRMYVVAGHRGRGHARAVLSHLERHAADAGADWAILVTGSPQAAAVGLYRSCGYADIGRYSVYAGEPDAIHLGKRLR